MADLLALNEGINGGALANNEVQWNTIIIVDYLAITILKLSQGRSNLKGHY